MRPSFPQYHPQSNALSSAQYLINFPGLTLAKWRKHCPNSIATAKGHMKQQRQGTRSTKTEPTPLPLLPEVDLVDEDFFPTSPPTGERTHYCYITVMEPTGRIFTDQSGRFIAPSSQGNNYIMLLYDYDSNTIHVAPMKNKTALCHKAAFVTIFNKLVHAGLRPIWQMLDNEGSKILYEFLEAEHITVQNTPADQHRRNAAERGLQTFKDHFIAGLCSTDPNFPLHLWDQLLQQSELTLNLLRGSRINPKLSAWAQVHGHFDFNATPIAPPGFHVVIHEPKHKTWAPKGLDAWYIGPELQSYRCYRTWVWETRSIRKAETLAWFPSHLKMPIASSTDIAIAAVQDLTKALNNPNHGSPLDPLSDSEVATLEDLTQILIQRSSPAADPSKPPPPPPADPAPVLRVEEPPANQATKPTEAEPTTLMPPSPRPVPPRRNNRHQQPPNPNPNPNPKHPKQPPSPNKPKHRHPHKKPKHRPSLPRAAKANAVQASPTPALEPAHYKWFYNTFEPDTIDPAYDLDLAYISIKPGCDLAFKAINPDTGELADYFELRKCSDGHHWENSCADEIGRLAQGRPPHMPTGTDTIRFIRVSDIPKGRRATYLRIVCTDRPQKTEPRRVRFTVGGDKIDYPFEVSTKTAGLITAKILFNSVISTPDAKFMTMDIKDFYLCTPMERPEYMRIPVAAIPKEMMDHYNLWPLVPTTCLRRDHQRNVRPPTSRPHCQ